MTGRVFDIQRFSVDDGDGIRTCVFLKGCPLRCVWCHNTESLSVKQELAFYGHHCIGCGACTEVCPTGAVHMEDGRVRLDRESCRVCGTCAEGCYAEALVLIGKEMTVEEVMDTVCKDRIFYGKDGGITITGGEPLMQPEFTKALAKAAKKEQISVAIETSGYGKTEDYLALLPYCDQFLFDCKASGDRHKELTGVEDTLILKNLEVICKENARVTLRCPVIPGANLSPAFAGKIGSLAEKYPAIREVRLMPYHKTGIGKSAYLGKTAQKEFVVPTEAMMREFAEQVRGYCSKPVS